MKHLQQCQAKQLVMEGQWDGANGIRAKIDGGADFVECLVVSARNNPLKATPLQPIFQFETVLSVIGTSEWSNNPAVASVDQ